MIEIEFTEEETEKLHYEHLRNPHPRVRQRCKVVYLKALGYPHDEIGRIVRVSQPTVRSYLKMYRTGGLEKLKEMNFYTPTRNIYPKSCTSRYCVKLTLSGKCEIIEIAQRRQIWQSGTQRN